jgi:hypothetical protein
VVVGADVVDIKVVLGGFVPLPRVIVYTPDLVVEIGPVYVTPFTENVTPPWTRKESVPPLLEVIVAVVSALFDQLMSTTKLPRATSPLTLPAGTADGRAGRRWTML